MPRTRIGFALLAVLALLWSTTTPVLGVGTSPVSFALAVSSVTEGAGSAMVTVTLEEDTPTDSLVVDVVDTLTGTATTGVDYTYSTTTLTFPAGTLAGATQDVLVTVLDDAAIEAGETVALQLTNIVDGVPGTIVDHVLTLDDDEAPATFDFFAAASSVDEAGPHTVDVSLAIPTGLTLETDVSVEVADAGGGTATPGADYDAAPVTVTFLAGSADGATAVAPLTLLGDPDVEGDESLLLLLQNPSAGSSLGSAQLDHTVTLLDDDTVAVSFVSDASTHGEAAGTSGISLTIGIAESGVLATDLTVDLVVAGGTATGADYVLGAASVVFPSGSPHAALASVNITPTDDLEVEGPETAIIDIGTLPSIATLGTFGSHTATVADDDEITLDFLGDVPVNEADLAGEATVIMTLPPGGTLVSDVTVTISDLGGSATAGADYSLIDSSVTFASGAADGATAPVAFTVTNDADHEGPETFTLALDTVTGQGTIGVVGTALVTIGDDDGVVIEFGAATSSVDEDALTHSVDVVLTVPGAGMLAEDIVVDVSDLGTGSATGGVDYTFSSPTTVTFLTGAADGSVISVPVTPTDDGDPEPDETIDLDLSIQSGFASLGSVSSHEVTLVDDDYIITATPTVLSGGEGETAEYTLVLGKAPSGTVLVSIATDASQVTSSAGTVSFDSSNWSTPQTVVLTIVNDDVHEPTVDTVVAHTVTAGADPGYDGLAVDDVVVTVTDDDPVPTVTVDSVTAAEGDSGTKTFSFTVSLSNPQSSDLDLAYATSDGTAVAGSDYTSAVGTLTIPALATSGRVDVEVLGDVEDEIDETFTLLVGAVSATGTITEDDNVAPVIVGAPDIVADEGASADVTVDWTEPGLQDPVTVTVDFGDGSAPVVAAVSPGTTTFTTSHTYADNGTFPVTYTVEDGDGGSDTVGATATIANALPLVVMPPDALIEEGSSFVGMGSFTDAGTADTHTATIDYGDGTGTQDLGLLDELFDLSHVYDDDGTYAAIACVLDDDLGLDCEATFVSVTNVAPVASIVGAPSTVVEGTPLTIVGDVDDVGTADTHVLDWTVTRDGAPYTTAQGDVLDLTPDDEGSYEVTLVATDDDGGISEAAIAVIDVTNAAPVPVIESAPDGAEGAPLTLIGSATDPGNDTLTFDWSVALGGTEVASGTSTEFTFTPGEDGIYDVTLTATDTAGDFGTTTAQLTVANVAPVIALSVAAGAVEGGDAVLTLGAVTDPGADTVTSYTVEWGDGTIETFSVAGDVLHTYADDGTYTITVDLTDEDGTFTGGSVDADIANVAPTIVLTGDPTALEGTAFDVALGEVTDPGDDLVSLYTVHWGDGTSTATSVDGIVTHEYPDDGTYDLTVDLTDEDGTYVAVDGFSVIVDNVPPTLELGGDESALEGTTFSLVLEPTTDPGADTVVEWIVHWEEGVTETFATAGTVTHVYADGPITPTIVVDLVDEDGTHLAAGSRTVLVDNVAPSITLTGDAVTSEGDSYTLTLGEVTDPGDDTVTSYLVDWGDGDSDVFTVGGDVTHNYSDDGSYTIVVDLVDDDGTAVAAATKSVTVNNVAPTFTADGPTEIGEGATYTLTLGTPTDPGDDVVSAIVVDWGDGEVETYVAPGPVTHVYPDGPDTATIRVDLVDEDGTYLDVVVITVSVEEVPAVIELTGAATAPEGEVYSLTLGTITDPGEDVVTQWRVHWGDGATDTYTSDGVVTHTYADGPLAAQITVDLLTEEGWVDAAGTLFVSVEDVDPLIAVTGDATVDEAATYTLTLEFISDPGGDVIETWLVDWGDGSLDELQEEGPVTHVYADDGVYNIIVDVIDEDGLLIGAGGIGLTVLNVAPVVGVTAGPAVLEGASYSFSVDSVTDPGPDTPTAYVINWGDGTSDTIGALGSATHAYPDNGSWPITVDVVDEDGTHPAAGTATATVTNVAPTGTVSGAASVLEGNEYVLTIETVSDPGDDTLASWTVHWGDGSSETFDAGSAATHRYPAGPSTNSIVVDFTDEDGTYAGVTSLIVDVANASPVIESVTVDSGTPEGSAVGLLVEFTDGGLADLHTATVNWGDGSFQFVGVNDGVGMGTVDATHTYGQDNIYLVEACVFDLEGGGACELVDLEVVNAPPVVDLRDSLSIRLDQSLTIPGTVTEPGEFDVPIATVTWGDGATDVYAVEGTTLHVPHDYVNVGAYEVGVTVDDGDGGVSSDTMELLVGNWVDQASGDFDGDGRDEVVLFSVSPQAWAILASNGTDYDPVLYQDPAPPSTERVIGDFDGNGRDDIAVMDGTTGEVWVVRSRPNGPSTSLWHNYARGSGWNGMVAGDFDGDGLDDIANYNQDTGDWWVMISSGTGAESVAAWTHFATNAGWTHRIAGDFNGDGKADIASYHTVYGRWWVALSQGNVFALELWQQFGTPGGWTSQIVGDFDGNGIDDIASYHPGAARWWVSLSTGSGFTTTLWAQFGTGSGWTAQAVGDFDGNGFDDVANYHSGIGRWWVSASNGSAFTTTLWVQFTTTDGWSHQNVGDFDADGTDDVVNYHATYRRWWVGISTGTTFTTTLWFG